VIGSEEVNVDTRVLGLDNVAIDLPVASVGNRVLAAVVDYLILGVLTIVLVIAGATISALIDNGTVFLVVFVVGGFMLNWGYFTVAEIATKGQTPGKQLLSLRVVTDNGGLPTAGALVIRTLLRIVDNLIGVILIAVDPRSRRLGDRLAGTLVVHDSPDRSDSLVLGRVPNGWGPAEVTLVEAFFDRRDTLDPDTLQRLAGRIVSLIERDDPAFLHEVEPGPTASATLWRAFRPDWI